MCPGHSIDVSTGPDLNHQHVRHAAIHHGPCPLVADCHARSLLTLCDRIGEHVRSRLLLSVPRGRDERRRLSRRTRQEKFYSDSGEVIYHASAGREGKSLPKSSDRQISLVVKATGGRGCQRSKNDTFRADLVVVPAFLPGLRKANKTTPRLLEFNQPVLHFHIPYPTQPSGGHIAGA
jgi:hypothetical protein